MREAICLMLLIHKTTIVVVHEHDVKDRHVFPNLLLQLHARTRMVSLSLTFECKVKFLTLLLLQ